MAGYSYNQKNLQAILNQKNLQAILNQMNTPAYQNLQNQIAKETAKQTAGIRTTQTTAGLHGTGQVVWSDTQYTQKWQILAELADGTFKPVPDEPEFSRSVERFFSKLRREVEKDLGF